MERITARPENLTMSRNLKNMSFAKGFYISPRKGLVIK